MASRKWFSSAHVLMVILSPGIFSANFRIDLSIPLTISKTILSALLQDLITPMISISISFLSMRFSSLRLGMSCIVSVSRCICSSQYYQSSTQILRPKALHRESITNILVEQVEGLVFRVEQRFKHQIRLGWMLCVL